MNNKKTFLMLIFIFGQPTQASDSICSWLGQCIFGDPQPHVSPPPAPYKSARLFEAVGNNDVSRVAELLARVNPNNKDEGRLPLCLAVEHTLPEMVRLLLAHGADVHLQDAYGHASIHYISACFKLKYGRGSLQRQVSEAEKIMGMLVGAGADLNSKAHPTEKIYFVGDEKEPGWGRTPLMFAISNCRDVSLLPMSNCRDASGYHAILALLREGVRVKERDNLEETALHYAARRTRWDPTIIELLLVRGAEVNAQTKKGKTPLHFCVDGDCSLPFTQTLLRAGADVTVRDSKGNTPLHIAAGSYGSKKIKVMQALLAAERKGECGLQH